MLCAAREPVIGAQVTWSGLRSDSSISPSNSNSCPLPLAPLAFSFMMSLAGLNIWGKAKNLKQLK